MNNRGIFISFEGGEGSGKSTQIHLLEESLRRNGYKVLILREPGGTKVGETIRQLLQHSDDSVSLEAEAELLLFAASRAQLVRECIRPALADGCYVLCDRFLDSTTVYQGVARRLVASEVAFINHFAVGDTLPDITFFLDLPWSQARERMRSRSGSPDRMEREPDAFHEAVRTGYQQLATQMPMRIIPLDASVSPTSLAATILHILSQKSYGVFT